MTSRYKSNWKCEDTVAPPVLIPGSAVIDVFQLVARGKTPMPSLEKLVEIHYIYFN